jgi:hypothetical protein
MYVRKSEPDRNAGPLSTLSPGRCEAGHVLTTPVASRFAFAVRKASQWALSSLSGIGASAYMRGVGLSESRCSN